MIKIRVYNLSNSFLEAFVNNKKYIVKNGSLDLNLCPGIYKVAICNMTVVFLYRGVDLEIPFVFVCQRKNNLRVIHLFDKFYNGLKIERGEIIFNGL